MNAVNDEIETIRNESSTDEAVVEKSTSSQVLEMSTNADDLECITSKQTESENEKWNLIEDSLLMHKRLLLSIY